jgi:hypothetical protein
MHRDHLREFGVVLLIEANCVLRIGYGPPKMPCLDRGSSCGRSCEMQDEHRMIPDER